MSAAVALSLLRRFWPAIPILLLGAALMATRATLADRTATLKAERTAWSAEIDRAEKQRAIDEARWASASASAAQIYADRLAAREPIILRSTDTVRTYAQTDAGRARCLGADRVRGIDALDTALFAEPAEAAGGSDAAVPADPDG